MSPTLFHGQSVLLVRPTFSWNQLRRGDVVVLRRPGPPYDTYIKRIIGLPDEEITLDGGNFYADDVLVVTPQKSPGDDKKDVVEWSRRILRSGRQPNPEHRQPDLRRRRGRTNNRPRLATLLAPKGMGVGTIVIFRLGGLWIVENRLQWRNILNQRIRLVCIATIGHVGEDRGGPGELDRIKAELSEGPSAPATDTETSPGAHLTDSISIDTNSNQC